MKVLGIDTAALVASAALVENGALILEKIFPEGGGNATPRNAAAQPRPHHAETLFPGIAELFNETGLAWEALSAIAVSIGPGSFTGLRIGLSAAKGLAYGWDVPVVGVSTLLAVARRSRDPIRWICPLLDARKNEVYAALFRREGERIERNLEDMVAPAQHVFQRVLSVVQDQPCLFDGNGAALYEASIRNTFGGRAHIAPDDHHPSVAFAVACIGEERVRGGEAGFAGSLVPQYLRSAEAERKLGQRIPAPPAIPLTKVTP